MTNRSNYRVAWHRFWRNFNLLLYDGCIDMDMRDRLLRKVRYHDMKMVQE